MVISFCKVGFIGLIVSVVVQVMSSEGMDDVADEEVYEIYQTPEKNATDLLKARILSAVELEINQFQQSVEALQYNVVFYFILFLLQCSHYRGSLQIFAYSLNAISNMWIFQVYSTIF